MMNKSFVFFVAAVLFVSVPLVLAQQWQAQIIHPDGYEYSEARAVDANSIAGQVQLINGQFGTPNRAFLWKRDPNAFIDLHDAGDKDTIAYGVSGNTQVGYEFDPNLIQSRALLWQGSAAGVTSLHPDGATNSVAWDVSGGIQSGEVDDRAWLWFGGTDQTVDLHPGGIYGLSSATCVYDDGGAGKQGGWVSETIFTTSRAAYWEGTAGSFVELHPDGGIYSSVNDIDNATQVGVADFRAAMWKGTAESYVSLHPDGATRSECFGVSGRWQTGFAVIDSRNRAWVWRGPYYHMDLHDLLPDQYVSSRANGIDADGRICGSAFTADDERHAVLWTPVEPLCSEDIASDLNGDCGVNYFDFVLLADKWQDLADVEMLQQMGVEWLD